jgi:elongator complex protein 3 (tRNA carboxymethyluridine synthase)
MEDACRLIIDEIIAGKIKTTKDLQKAKLKVCRDYKLEKFMSNSLILENATYGEKKKISNVIKRKPTRTLSGVAVVAVMCRPQQCPHGRCIYCPETKKAPPSYTGEEPAALRARNFNFNPYQQVYNRLLQLESIGHPLDKVELIIMGGTFPSHFICYQEWFVTECLRAMVDYGEKIQMKSNYLKTQEIFKNYFLLEDIQKANENSKIRCVGITFETRPDFCKIQDVDRMLNMGVTRVELGVQTIYNFIYNRIHRGHGVSEVIESTRILRDSGLKLVMHLMPGLFADFERDMRIFNRLFTDSRFKPDMLKIYPTLVVKGTELYEIWKNGDFEPYSTDEAVNLIVEIKRLLPKWVRTMRIQRDIPSPLIEAGVKKSNLGELVYKRLNDLNINCKCIRCREVGHKAVNGITPCLDNIKLLREEYVAGESEEIFISYEDVMEDILIGFLRLRIPSNKSHRKEIDDNTAIVRELHVYGPMMTLGERKTLAWQHKGYGKDLIIEAEKVASEIYDKKEIFITSGVGARNYYKKLGYKRKGPYMAKNLKK